MAKYTITMSCGHDETHQIYGPGKDRQRKADYLASRVCSECYRTKQAAEREAANTSAAATAKAEKRPDLEGSERQVAWAESIRQMVWDQLDRAEMMVIERAPAGDPAAAKITDAIEDIRNRAAASWWIENRNRLASIADVSTKTAVTYIYEF